MKASLYYKSDNILGEGPIWDHRSQELVWVDIDGKTLNFLKNPTAAIEQHIFQLKIGFAALAEEDIYVVGLENGLYRYNRRDHSLSILTDPSLHREGLRWNDGKTGLDGCIWGGTMAVDQTLYQGSLYRLDRNLNLKKMLAHVSISNGLAWNSDLGKMYFVDSPLRSVQTFQYKKGDPEIGVPDFTFNTHEDMGYPDGMTIDEDGMLWIAHWDGACIGRWHPGTGQLITKIDIPAPRVTSCIFGGQGFSTLFVSTARTGLSKEQLENYPLSGSLFTIDTNTKGLEPPIFSF